MIQQRIFEMELHEQLLIEDKDFAVLRVPGGWIYKFQFIDFRGSDESYRTSISTVFVPLSSEFKQGTWEELGEERRREGGGKG